MGKCSEDCLLDSVSTSGGGGPAAGAMVRSFSSPFRITCPRPRISASSSTNQPTEVLPFPEARLAMRYIPDWWTRLKSLLLVSVT